MIILNKYNGGFKKWRKIIVYFQNVRSVMKDIYCLFHSRKMFLRNGNVVMMIVDTQFRKEREIRFYFMGIRKIVL